MHDTNDYTGPERRVPPHVETIRAAVAEGIRDAVSDPALWDAAGKAMREQAQTAAGGWLFGGLRALMNRVLWIAAIFIGIYTLGGWSAVVSFFKSGAVKP